MKTTSSKLLTCLAAFVAMGGLSGCETGGSGGSGGSSTVSTSFYYGTGFYDPWYYGGYYPPDVIVGPPSGGEGPPSGGQPPSGSVPRPEHPIAKPPDGPQVSPSTRPAMDARSGSVNARPAPSIPTGPRPMPRMGGRR